MPWLNRGRSLVVGAISPVNGPQPNLLRAARRPEAIDHDATLPLSTADDLGLDDATLQFGQQCLRLVEHQSDLERRRADYEPLQSTSSCGLHPTPIALSSLLFGLRTVRCRVSAIIKRHCCPERGDSPLSPGVHLTLATAPAYVRAGGQFALVAALSGGARASDHNLQSVDHSLPGIAPSTRGDEHRRR
jgi:hypothetical protein